MKPAWQTSDASAQIFLGDCRESMRQMPEASINCCVTSPPYWGLRDYGCDGQLGLEKTPEEYVAHMVEVFREVRRVLRDDGTLWLNLGDSYNARPEQRKTTDIAGEKQKTCRGSVGVPSRSVAELKPKDLCGIPWRVAFALQADGWWLRQDIIWHKPNPMPESVTDRCTKAHEYIFLLSKSARYYYDADAVKEPSERAGCVAGGGVKVSRDSSYLPATSAKQHLDTYSERPLPENRNRHSVWTVATKPYSGAHFATFPPDLIEPCILAGCPESGTVLDPFNGSGTTGAVCMQHGRRYVGCELNAEYIELAKERIGQAQRRFDTPLLKPKIIQRELLAT